MIVYNVTIKVDNEKSAEWEQWMKEEHLPDLMTTGLFTDSRLCRMLEQDETDGITYSAQYTCNSMDDYNKYIEVHAEGMREKVMKRYAGHFVAFRSVMQVL